MPTLIKCTYHPQCPTHRGLKSTLTALVGTSAIQEEAGEAGVQGDSEGRKETTTGSEAVVGGGEGKHLKVRSPPGFNHSLNREEAPDSLGGEVLIFKYLMKGEGCVVLTPFTRM